MIDMWICNGFVVIYDSSGRMHKGTKPEQPSEK